VSGRFLIHAPFLIEVPPLLKGVVKSLGPTSSHKKDGPQEDGDYNNRKGFHSGR
jgi:hypothetical protein